ncbi:TIGR03862 family flavoprotein [Oleispirillum naphthae]|uniref:TIGR03862 family flavoprotein n=1 Tax=Oleispirillum naphthae TaxID=2838853 RepID=UPI0030822452
MTRSALIVGGGPAGLMAAETLAAAGAAVEVCEAMPTPGRKFLRAGIGGLNLTRDEDLDSFLGHYGAARAWIAPYLAAFGPGEARAWADGLGADTFTGSSRRVFPRAMKAAPLLRAWLARLSGLGVAFSPRCRWTGWDETGAPAFATPQGPARKAADAVVLALGGASWPRLGGDGSWTGLLAARGVAFSPWRPANCGFDVAWSDPFRDKFAGTPLPTATFSCCGRAVRGAAVITATGIEGGAVYALSAPLRDAIANGGTAELTLDLAPDRAEAALARALAAPRGAKSLSTHLARCGLGGVRGALLREIRRDAAALSPAALARLAKALPLTCLRPRPLAEAISSAGGVALTEVDGGLMLTALPGVFCAGEMLDWEAPTGGYLLTACLSLGRAAGAAAAARLG